MSCRVVDASVAIKWFFPEPNSESALRLLGSGAELLVPDLVFAEVGNVVWRRVYQVRGNEPPITRMEAASVIDGLTALPLRVFALSPLLPAALGIACETGCSIYDSLYLALAVQEHTQVVTADARFFNKTREGPHASSVVWVDLGTR